MAGRFRLALLLASVGVAVTQAQPPVASPPAVRPADVPHVYPINLPTALQLAQVRPLDILIAEQRLEAARAQLDRANVLCLPNLTIGADYARHDGQIQDVVGNV